jgi:folate-dependent phosphoribosylglycinamide formyltransferase PurN
MTTGQERPIVLVAGEGESSRMVCHALAAEFGAVAIIIEDSVSKLSLVKRRIRKLGLLTVAGQLLFQTIVVPVLHRSSRGRIAAIKREHRLDDGPFPEDAVCVSSMNSDQAREALRRLNPAVVVVNGTRILSRETLECVSARFINTHAGFTPLYRGVHGGYWALVDGRCDLVGTTVHLVDEGIDTGTVVAQATFTPDPQLDNFTTYPYLHIATGIPLLLRAVRQALSSSLQPATAGEESLPSRLRSHPTLWGYCARRLVRGVR